MHATEFEAAGKRLVERIAEYLANVSNGRVMPKISREECFAEFANTLGDSGIGLDRVIGEEFDRIIKHSMAMNHPLYLGLVNSSPWPPAALGDLLVSIIDNNNGATHQGPVAASVEREILRELSERLDYPCDGLFLPGGTFANLHAMILARNIHFPEWETDGPHALKKLPRIYVADGSHLSIVRSAMAAGFGKSSISVIRAGARGEMLVEDLQRAIDEDLQAGHQPFAVFATAGATGTGAIDPLSGLANICVRHKLWFHVDACYGGAVGLVPELAHLMDGMNRADSIAIDLHKWLFMPLTAGIFMTRHADANRSAFRIAASYIPDGDYVEAYQRGLPTSRRSTPLAVWFAIRACGWKTLLDHIPRNIKLTREIEKRLAALGFRVMPGGLLSIACSRWEPDGVGVDRLNDLQIAIARRVCDSGQAWFATTIHAGQSWLRLNMVNLYTQSEHLDTLIDALVEAAGLETAKFATTQS